MTAPMAIASGTTPKMIKDERDARMIGYGAMLLEGLVGITALVAAACLEPGDYYAINVATDKFAQLAATLDKGDTFFTNTDRILRESRLPELSRDLSKTLADLEGLLGHEGELNAFLEKTYAA